MVVMEQMSNIIYFLPCIVCLLWLGIFCFRVKTTTQRWAMGLLLLCIFYFFTYAFYLSPVTDYRVMAILDMVNMPVIFAMLAVNLLFVFAHHSNRLHRTYWNVILAAPFLVMLGLNVVLYLLLGFDEVADFYAALDRDSTFPEGYDDALYYTFYQINVNLVRYPIVIYIIATIVVCQWLSYREGARVGAVFRFFFRGSVASPTRVICFLDIVMLVLLVPMAAAGRSYMFNHHVLSFSLTLLLSFCLFFLCYVEYMIDTPEFSLSSLSHFSLIDQTEAVTPAETEPEADAADDVLPVVADDVCVPPAIIQSVRQAFDVERVYLDPNLSIQTLAQQLSSNRTTLSQAIAQAYGVNFRQVVAQYRIEAAKNYMLAHPDAKQGEVAIECGFLNAPAFNQKFKEMVGESPRVWASKLQ